MSYDPDDDPRILDEQDRRDHDYADDHREQERYERSIRGCW